MEKKLELQTLEDMFDRLYSALRGWNYDVNERIGTGRFCDVYKCLNLGTDVIVAVKVITILEKYPKDGVPSSVIREISILKELEHANIVRLLGVLNKDYHNVFLVFEYLDLDLYKFMGDQTIPKDALLVKKFLHQMLSAIAYFHSLNILHRDLKPQNVLVDLTDKKVKVADFGLAKDSCPVLSNTKHVGTFWYMAPEVLFGSTKYSTSCDMWSVGCIFAEMLLGQPLFSATEQSQALKDIFSLLGTPTEETWPGITTLCNLDPPTEPKDLANEFPNLEPAGLDLLSKMLCVYPNHRISAEDALEHEFFNGIEMVQ
ncbi:hypothetical protein L6164_026550 [Bauhinia variegata]|uniref:Uncharacterized protein n=1 Tax=Bauhinia variegata TaxID=167791 RepID=A0ACB9LQA6_BAUVA|nr:hypothetical protein L6164_026550 [Bauhinia variegata]